MKKKTIIGFPIVIVVAVLLIIVAFGGFFNTSENRDEKISESHPNITSEDIVILDWIEQNLEKESVTIASDHRLERMIEAKGFTTTQTTQNETYFLWASGDFTECIDELFGIGKDYSNITHVFIDDIMKETLVYYAFREGINITNESYNKFKQQPFELVYRSETIEIDPESGEPVHWAELYKFNSTYFV